MTLRRPSLPSLIPRKLAISVIIELLQARASQVLEELAVLAEQVHRLRDLVDGALEFIGQALLQRLVDEAAEVLGVEQVLRGEFAAGEGGDVDALVGVYAVDVATEAEGVCDVG